jgi:hypothetical protein
MQIILREIAGTGPYFGEGGYVVSGAVGRFTNMPIDLYFTIVERTGEWGSPFWFASLTEG